jgi:hypothetical protein
MGSKKKPPPEKAAAATLQMRGVYREVPIRNSGRSRCI